MNKVLALQSAMRCFACGFLAFIPLLGIPFAVAAMVFNARASGHAPDDWHIARRYAGLGMFFAGIGLLLNVTALAWIAILWAQNQW